MPQTPPFDLRPLEATPHTLDQLSTLLVETVANGDSVSFMHPLPYAQAEAFWQGSLASSARGERVVLGAWDGETLVSTVTLLLDYPPNQPHRAEIAKMMTRLPYRGRGAARALLERAEGVALERGRTLLMLDTATDGGPAGMYQKLGYVLVGEVPDFALKPYGGLSGTLFFYKRLGG